MKVHTSSTPKKKRPQVGDRKTVKGVEYVRQFERDSQGAFVRRHGHPAFVWEEVKPTNVAKPIPKLYKQDGTWKIVNSGNAPLDDAAAFWCWRENDPEEFTASCNPEDAASLLRILAAAGR